MSQKTFTIATGALASFFLLACGSSTETDEGDSSGQYGSGAKGTSEGGATGNDPTGSGATGAGATGGGVTPPQGPGSGEAPNTPSAFNQFDETTYAKSTCENLAIEKPEGIFVATSGNATGAGTQKDPLDLLTALSGESPAKGGDTIWIKGGLYNGSFSSNVSGDADNPIKIKPMPGQRVILDSKGGEFAALTMNGQWVDVYGLELISSDTNRGSIEEDEPVVFARSGITVLGASTNMYNMIVHDNVGSGVDFWKTATNSILHGTIIYNNGYSAKGRGHGHGVYTQNTNGFKTLSNNIVFFGYQTGLHPYSTKKAPLNNFTIEKNVWFIAGGADPRRSQQKTNCIISSPAGVRNLAMRDNLGYSQVDRGTSINTGDGMDIGASFTNNYLVEKLEIYGNWGGIDFVDNTIYGNIADPDSQLNDVSGNILDTSRPTTGKNIFVEKNGVDTRRGRVVIYNYDESDKVSVDLSSLLKEGEAYRIHNVFGLFDEPLLSGVFTGSEIEIPMGTVAPPQPHGDDQGIAPEDGPGKRFGTFIVTHGGCK